PHRLVSQASAEVGRLDGTYAAALESDGLWTALERWSEAAEALEEALARARPALLADGTPPEQISWIRERLTFVRKKARHFSLEEDLGECVDAWNGVELELSQLSGRASDALVKLFQERKPTIDGASAMLSQARQQGGLLEEEYRKLGDLRQRRDRAREKYERLR